MESGQVPRARDFKCQLIIKSAKRLLLSKSKRRNSLDKRTQINHAIQSTFRLRLGLSLVWLTILPKESA